MNDWGCNGAHKTKDGEYKVMNLLPHHLIPHNPHSEWWVVFDHDEGIQIYYDEKAAVSSRKSNEPVIYVKTVKATGDRES